MVWCVAEIIEEKCGLFIKGIQILSQVCIPRETALVQIRKIKATGSVAAWCGAWLKLLNNMQVEMTLVHKRTGDKDRA